MKKNKSQEKKINHLEIQTQSIQAPLYAPHFLKEYGTIDPSFPERILRMAEKQQDERIKREQESSRNETMMLKRTLSLETLGLVLFFILILTFLGIGVFLIFKGYKIEGYVALIGALTPFFYSTFFKKNKN